MKSYWKLQSKDFFFSIKMGKKWVMKKNRTFWISNLKRIIVFHVQRCLKPSKSFLNASQVLKWMFGWKAKNQFPLSLIIMPTELPVDALHFKNSSKRFCVQSIERGRGWFSISWKIGDKVNGTQCPSVRDLHPNDAALASAHTHNFNSSSSRIRKLVHNILPLV